MSKKDEHELLDKLGRKVHANAMPNAAQFKNHLLSFQRDLEKSKASKAYSKEAMLGGPTHLNFGKGGVHLNLGISHEPHLLE